MTRPEEYPAGLTERGALEALVASCEKLRHEMGGIEATKNCTHLITSWEHGHPSIFYLERNMRWAREVLARATG